MNRFIKFISGNEVFYMAPGDFYENIFWGDLGLCDLDILAENPEHYDVTRDINYETIIDI